MKSDTGKENLVLVGFMGTGKTAVARALASDLNRMYVSVDDLIVEREGRSISDIFAQEGEPYFRRVEKEVVKEVSADTGQVIDAGGGVVLDPENMSSMRKNGIVICLWAEPEKIHERTRRHGHRPLLEVEDPLRRIKDLLEKRKPYYEKADHHVDTSAVDIAGVVTKIKELIHG